MSSIMSNTTAAKFGYSEDKRKRRNQHRNAARRLIRDGGFFRGYGYNKRTTFGSVAYWHLQQARYLGR